MGPAGGTPDDPGMMERKYDKVDRPTPKLVLQAIIVILKYTYQVYTKNNNDFSMSMKIFIVVWA